jgi:hypothetical protein
MNFSCSEEKELLGKCKEKPLFIRPHPPSTPRKTLSKPTKSKEDSDLIPHRQFPIASPRFGSGPDFSTQRNMDDQQLVDHLFPMVSSPQRSSTEGAISTNPSQLPNITQNLSHVSHVSNQNKQIQSFGSSASSSSQNVYNRCTNSAQFPTTCPFKVSPPPSHNKHGISTLRKSRYVVKSSKIIKITGIPDSNYVFNFQNFLNIYGPVAFIDSRFLNRFQYVLILFFKKI